MTIAHPSQALHFESNVQTRKSNKYTGNQKLFFCALRMLFLFFLQLYFTCKTTFVVPFNAKIFRS